MFIIITSIYRLDHNQIYKNINIERTSEYAAISISDMIFDKAFAFPLMEDHKYFLVDSN